MSGVGFWELVILLLIGLVVLGPERLPRVANQLGGWLGQARRMTRVMKRQLEDELNIEKHLDILPPARTQHSNPGVYQAPATDKVPVDDDYDDTYSPAHDKDSTGTGVDKDEKVAADVTESASPRNDVSTAPDPGQAPADDDTTDKKSTA
ncbi:MAG: twin-arginine translocase subunit TatB [Halioglobus sp.]|nr:twin-arginine translocase subunit TatB [Halioglobus sp.]